MEWHVSMTSCDTPLEIKFAFSPGCEVVHSGIDNVARLYWIFGRLYIGIFAKRLEGSADTWVKYMEDAFLTSLLKRFSHPPPKSNPRFASQREFAKVIYPIGGWAKHRCLQMALSRQSPVGLCQGCCHGV
jgi:hypothetical protein